MEKLYTKVDLGTRWGVSRQVVNNWSTRRNDFPAPIQFVSNGAIPLYLESDIKAYEEKRGLFSEYPDITGEDIERSEREYQLKKLETN